MDTALVQVLTNFGALGVVIVLILFQILVPFPYVKKLEEALNTREKEVELLRQANRELINSVAVTNQVLGALKSVVQEKQEASKRLDSS